MNSHETEGEFMVACQVAALFLVPVLGYLLCLRIGKIFGVW